MQIKPTHSPANSKSSLPATIQGSIRNSGKVPITFKLEPTGKEKNGLQLLRFSGTLDKPLFKEGSLRIENPWGCMSTLAVSAGRFDGIIAANPGQWARIVFNQRKVPNWDISMPSSQFQFAGEGIDLGTLEIEKR